LGACGTDCTASFRYLVCNRQPGHLPVNVMRHHFSSTTTEGFRNALKNHCAVSVLAALYVRRMAFSTGDEMLGLRGRLCDMRSTAPTLICAVPPRMALDGLPCYFPYYVSTFHKGVNCVSISLLQPFRTTKLACCGRSVLLPEALTLRAIIHKADSSAAAAYAHRVKPLNLENFCASDAVSDRIGSGRTSDWPRGMG